MVIFVLLILYGYLVLAPLPPIHPNLPRPLHLHTHKRGDESRSGSPGVESSLQQVAFTQEQAAKPAPEQPVDPHLAAASPQALQQLYTRVAARSLGEGSFALPEIACTIKNRLRVSRASLSAVLRAYHARDVQPKPAQIEVVRQVFEGEFACPATWWYALSLQDTKYWRPHHRPPVKVIKQSDRKQILIFDR